MPKRAVEFNANGVTLRGTFFTPESGSGPFPAVVFAHGFSGVKEQALEDYAEVCSQHGMAALAYDHRCLGESDGEPRQDIDPIQQARDFRQAITYVQSLDEVDAERIGIWGSSYTGAQVLMLGAVDHRVKAIVSQVPLISGYRNLMRLIPNDAVPDLLKQLDAERVHLLNGGTPNVMQMCSDDPNVPHAFPGETTYRYLTEKLTAPNWKNEVTVRSIDWSLEFDVTQYLDRIGPTPLLMIVATEDTTTPTDEALKAFHKVTGPKELKLISGHHYLSYVENFDVTSQAAADFFAANL